MAEPTKLRLKRRADEDGPDMLILESSSRSKRTATPLTYLKDFGNGEFAVSATGVKRDVRVPAAGVKNAVSGENSDVEGVTSAGGPVRRLFRLNKRRASSSGVGVATFVENKVKKEVAMEKGVRGNDNGGVEDVPEFKAPIERPLKPPSARARVTIPEGRTRPGIETQEERARMQKLAEELADYTQQAVLEETKRDRSTVPSPRIDAKPTKVTPPRLSGQRSQALHQQRIISNNALPSTKDIEMDNEAGYVYDTYVLARSSDFGAVAQSGLGNVGYLVITEEDEPLWQSYLEDEVSEEEGDSADEDENAEDFYGADYPEDELEDDDEFGVNAYDYRGRLPEDEEEWDEETGEHSEDEGLEERMERLMRIG